MGPRGNQAGLSCVWNFVEGEVLPGATPRGPTPHRYRRELSQASTPPPTGRLAPRANPGPESGSQNTPAEPPGQAGDVATPREGEEASADP